MRGDDEKEPLAVNAGYAGGYPPAPALGYNYPTQDHNGGYMAAPGGPQGGRPQFTKGPGSRSETVLSDKEWRQRARPPQRGKTRKVKLTKGNFINEYPVPERIKNSVEPRYIAAGAFFLS